MRDLHGEARLTMQDRNVDVQEGIRLRSVRRRLFQEDDDRRRDLNTGVEDNVANCFFEEVRKHREEAKKRWNFDFEKEIPLPGNYQWVKLDRDGNEIPMIAEAENKTAKTEEVMEKEEGEQEKEEDPPEEREADADDKAEPGRQKDRRNMGKDENDNNNNNNQMENKINNRNL
ncbi:hypothetical protein KPH14_003003 [Odynerus spinipes]|uniref:Cyclin-dependent kinase inhibitor domain-containing protein n=1 Tax=Odynerus spinipes TaxID=1348599 RepID=A0AAD9RXG9_9HYME|nr:hypothetical protein KPH14_003003 [Odynerus spinipes]